MVSKASDNHELIAGYLDRDVLKIMFAGANYNDVFLGHITCALVYIWNGQTMIITGQAWALRITQAKGM